MSKENSQKITEKINAVSQELKELALSLHSRPELSFHEFFACETLTKILEKYGYQVQKGAAGTWAPTKMLGAPVVMRMSWP